MGGAQYHGVILPCELCILRRLALRIAVCDFGNVTVVVGKHLFEGDGCLRVGGLLDEMIAENLSK